MASCERCWELSGGNADRYAELIKVNKCTPEEQAGREASKCPKCGRMTVHQLVNVCMVPECDYREPEEPPAPPATKEVEEAMEIVAHTIEAYEMRRESLGPNERLFFSKEKVDAALVVTKSALQRYRELCVEVGEKP